MPNQPDPSDSNAAPIEPDTKPAFQGSEEVTLQPPSSASDEQRRSEPSDLDSETLPICHGEIPASAASPPKSIRYFGDYEVIHEIARGGMGVVYKARQKKLNRIVAVKMILSGELASEEAISRFFAEAQAAATLDHPGIVPVYEIGQHDGQHYFSMGYIDGHSLADRVAKGPLPPKEAAEITRKIAEAIAYAHDKGVIHRDLKPANVLMDTNGEPKVTDFGLARIQEQNSGMTRTGSVMGTPSYMPPEQAAGKTNEVGPLSDVYSLGAILYCLLTGRPPFQAANPLDTLMQVMEKEPVSVQSLNSGVPRDLETICHKCLQKEPSKRYASAQAFADDLGRWVRGEPIRARAVSGTERAVRWVKRNKLVSGLLTGTFAAILLGSFASLWFGIEAKSSERRALLMEKEARGQKERATGSLARSNFLLALARWDDNRVAEANELLKLIPQDHRNLEWGLAVREFEGSELTENETTQEISSEIKFSPDGLRMVSAGDAIRIWDTSRVKVIRTIKVPSPACSVAFSPNGSRFVSGSWDGTVKIWDSASGEEIMTLGGHANPVTDVEFSPDGFRIVSGSGEHIIKLWDSESGEELQTLNGHGILSDVAFSPDGHKIISGSYDHNVRLWDVTHRKELRILSGHQERVNSVAFSPDGSRIASGGWDGIRLWDVGSGEEIRTRKGQTRDAVSGGVAFSPDGHFIASCGSNGAINIWDHLLSDAPMTLKGHESFIMDFAYSPDGSRLASIDVGKVLKFWDNTKESGSRLFTGHKSGVANVVYDPEGSTFASRSMDGTVKLWNAVSGENIRTFHSQASELTGVAFRRDGTCVVSGRQDNMLKLWDLSIGEELIPSFGHTSVATSVAINPNASLIASASEDNTINIWDIVDIRKPLTLKGHASHVTCVAFSYDGLRIVSGSKDDRIKIWDAQSGLEIMTFNGVVDDALSVAFSHDNSRVVSLGTSKPRMKIWDANNGQMLRWFKGNDRIVSVAISPDGSRIASGDEDSNVKLWDVTTGEELQTLRGHKSSVTSVSFSPDGSRIISGSSDATVRVWESAAYKRDDQEFRRRFAAPKPHWHREQAEKFQASGELYPELFHRAWLVKIDPGNAELRKQLKETHGKFVSVPSNEGLPLPKVVRQMLEEPEPTPK